MSRRSLFTALIVGVLAAMTLAGIALAVFVSAGGGTGGLGLGGRIAIVEVDGVIADDQEFLERVRRLREDPSVRGWVVAINSPGGVVAPSQSMFGELERIRVEDGEPVVAAIGSVGASGGYYVALAADSILAMPGSITGSIGVIMEFPNVRGLMDHIGVDVEIVKSGGQKDIGSPYRAMEEEDRAILGALVEDVHSQFVEVVAEARGMPVDEVRALADGRVLSGRQALGVGLIDGLGNLEEAVAVAGRMAGLGPDPRVLRPRSQEVPWLLDLLVGPSAAVSLQELAGSLRQLAGTINGAVAESGPVLKYIVR